MAAIMSETTPHTITAEEAEQVWSRYRKLIFAYRWDGFRYFFWFVLGAVAIGFLCTGAGALLRLSEPPMAAALLLIIIWFLALSMFVWWRAARADDQLMTL